MLASEETAQYHSACISYLLSAPQATISFVEISLNAEICVPLIKVEDGKVSVCFSDSECDREFFFFLFLSFLLLLRCSVAEGDKSDAAFFGKLASEAAISAGVDLCLVGSTFAERMRKLDKDDQKGANVTSECRST